MARVYVVVRAAEQHDVPALVALWGELKRCGALTPRHAALADDRHIDDRVRRLLDRPGSRILLAFVADEAVGMTMLTTVPLGALNETPCVQVEYTVVAEAHRRRGVGRALMGAAAAYAEEIGAEQVTVTVAPSSREANRFYAQLGLVPLSVRRVAPAAALRRRIALVERSAAPEDRTLRRRPVVTRTGLRASNRTGMRAALRRIAIAPTVAEQPHDA